MTRTFTRYTDTRMQQALNRARNAPNWPDDASLYDMAGHILAGPGADDATVDDAARQVALMMERS